MKNLINNIRTHHWSLGEKKNDFLTTTGTTYQYDQKTAGGAKSNLDPNLKADLRATHYKLGYNPEGLQTTHQATYTEMPNCASRVNDPQLRKSHFTISTTNHGFNNKTIYMTDFTKKDLVDV
jgi:hypothetical protein